MANKIRNCCSRTAIFLSFLAFGTFGFGQRVEDSCSGFFDNRHQTLDCLEALFTEKDIPYYLPHLTMSSIPPANGFPIGVLWEKRTYNVSPFSPAWRDSGTTDGGTSNEFKSLADLQVGFVASTNSSWYGTGAFSWLPPLHYRDDYRKVDDSRRSCHRLGPICTQQVFGINLSLTHRVLQTINFYGLGPSSSNTESTFRQTETYGRVDARLPLSDWLTIQGLIGNTKPNVQFSAASPSSAAISEQTAPGVLSQPDFMYYALGVRTRFQFISEPKTDDPAITPPGENQPPLMKHKLIFVFENNVLENWYRDQDTGHYSFRKFEIDGSEIIRLHSVVRRFVPPEKMSTGSSVLRHFCNSRQTGLKVKDECDFGQLTIRPLLISTFATAASGVVPFYFQPTLGGSDIESLPTLRGFNDYRFRAPSAAMVGVEYGVPVFNPIGALVFYEAGNVGNAISDLSLAHLRQNAGYGISLRLQRTVVAEAYLAYGAGHGSRFGYNFTKLF